MWVRGCSFVGLMYLESETRDREGLHIQQAQPTLLTTNNHAPLSIHVRHSLSRPSLETLLAKAIAVTMANGPSIPELEPPIKIKDALAEQRSDFDCLSCRLMGMPLECPHSIAFLTQLV